MPAGSRRDLRSRRPFRLNSKKAAPEGTALMFLEDPARDQAASLTVRTVENSRRSEPALTVTVEASAI